MSINYFKNKLRDTAPSAPKKYVPEHVRLGAKIFNGDQNLNHNHDTNTLINNKRGRNVNYSARIDAEQDEMTNAPQTHDDSINGSQNDFVYIDDSETQFYTVDDDSEQYNNVYPHQLIGDAGEDSESESDHPSDYKVPENIIDVNEYLLMVFGKLVAFGSLEHVESVMQLMVYGEHEEFPNKSISTSDMVLLKRINIKVGVFANE